MVNVEMLEFKYMIWSVQALHGSKAGYCGVLSIVTSWLLLVSSSAEQSTGV